MERTQKTEHIKNLLHQLTEVITESRSVNFNDVPLDGAEIAAVLLTAQERKAIAMKTAEYWEGISKEPEQVSMNPEQLKDWAPKTFAERNGKDYVIDRANKEIFDLLVCYFAGYETGELDLKKGLLLYGNVGCGKTAMMKMFRSNPFQSYSVRSCREVSDLVEQNGTMELNYFMEKINTSQNQFRHFKLGICFDDLGLEPIETVHFGNRKKIMEEILWTRYHNDIPFNFTHITTNLRADDISERYGERIASRMTEMFNFIAFPDDAPDRRRK